MPHLRHSDKTTLHTSSIIKLEETTASGARSTSIALDALKPVTGADICWHGLFPCGVIATGFSPSPREEGKGLEISFPDMVLASRCLSFAQYGNGLIANGLTSVLIPIAGLQKDKAVQWHFEDKTKQSSSQLANISQILKLRDIESIYEELDPQKLVGARCFLGWAEKANVVIGTKEYKQQMEWSSATKSPANCFVNSIVSHLVLDFFGMVTATGAISRTPASLQASISSSHQKDIYDMITLGKDHFVLLFDTGK